MGLAARKPIFRVSSETSLKVAILLVASLDIKLSSKRITKALITVCADAGLRLCCWQTLNVKANTEDFASQIEYVNKKTVCEDV